MARKRIDYTKMHLISQAMYEKLMKCLSDDKKTPFDETRQSISIAPTYSESTSALHSHEPIPGPSTINPSTGEYYDMPIVVPPDFQYEESTMEPTGDITSKTPNVSMFESYDSDLGTHHSLKKGKKTNDPSKIKSSANIKKKYEKSLIPQRVRNRSDLIPQTTLPTITEETSFQISPQQSIGFQPRPALQYIQPTRDYSPPGIREEIPDFNFDSPPRPLRTSTPIPSKLPRPIQRLPISSDVSRQSNISLQQPIPTRSNIKLLPLKSCSNRPKVKVTYSDGDSSMKNLPSLGKFKCPYCNQYLSTKYSLTRHIQRMHTPSTDVASTSQQSPPSSPPPSDDPSTFSNWTQLGKRTSSEANLKQHQQRKYRSNPSESKKRFDSWNL